LGYVVNVIEDLPERAMVLRESWALARKVLIVSARLRHEQKDEKASPYNDGWLSGSRTFQKYYEQKELNQWIDDVLGVKSIAAAPGIFYVFRDGGLRESLLATRFSRRRTARTRQLAFDRYKDLLDPLMQFVTARGRLPEAPELEQWSTIRDQIGSI